MREMWEMEEIQQTLSAGVCVIWEKVYSEQRTSQNTKCWNMLKMWEMIILE